MWTAVLFTVFCCSQAINLRATNTTALDDYVAFDDGEFAWFDTGEKIDGLFSCEGYVLNRTSQRGLTANDSSASVWTHQLVVLVPHELKTKAEQQLTDNTTPLIWKLIYIKMLWRILF